MLRPNETPNLEQFETNEISLNYEQMNELDSFGCSIVYDNKAANNQQKADDTSASQQVVEDDLDSNVKRIKLDKAAYANSDASDLKLDVQSTESCSDSDENLIIDLGVPDESATKPLVDSGPASPVQSDSEMLAVTTSSKLIPLEKFTKKEAESQAKPSLFDMMLKVQNKLKTNIEAGQSLSYSNNSNQSNC